MSRPDRRKTAASVFLGALALRLAYAWRQGLPVPIVGDALEYHDYALHLVETGRYFGTYGDKATRMPGYPLFLALCRALSGGSLAATVAAQCVLGAATCLLLYRLARRLLPEPWPAVCGALAAGYYGLIAPCSSLISESVFSFFLVASAYALYESAWSLERRAAGFGGLGALLYLIRPEPLPYLLATAASLPRLLPGFKRAHALRALAALALVSGLWVGRNFAVFGRLVPASTMGKTVAYLGLFLPAERLGLAEGRHYPPAGLTELEREDDFAAELKTLAARLTWPQIARCYLYNLLSILYPFLPEYDWTYVFVLPFALVGAWLSVRRKDLRPFAGAIACSLSTFMVFGGYASRYRQGIAPFVVLLGAAGMAELWKRAGAARARAWTVSWLGANLAVWLFGTQARLVALRFREVLVR